jgi:hypothetical protein
MKSETNPHEGNDIRHMDSEKCRNPRMKSLLIWTLKSWLDAFSRNAGSVISGAENGIDEESFARETEINKYQIKIWIFKSSPWESQKEEM